jgi:hypothetical protein
MGGGERQRAGGWRVVTALPHTSAVLLQGALRAEGVRAELERDGLAAVYGLDGAGLSTRIVVPAAEADRALRILSELESPA